MIPSVRRLPKVVLIGAAILGVVAIAVVVVLLSGGGSSKDEAKRPPAPGPSPTAPEPAPGPPSSGPAAPPKPKVPVPHGAGYPNGDTANTRRVSGPITAKSVARLKVAWSHPLTAKSTYGSYASTPVVRQGVVYSQDLASNVEAIDLRTGKVLWSKDYNVLDQGPNGLVVAHGRVFGATGTAAFALDQRTGRELWSVELIRNALEGIDMAPGYHDGMVYVSTVPGNATQFYNAGGAGVLWALDAKTGKKRWHFDTVPRGLWRDVDVNMGGGLWYTPAFDDQGDMYFGVGNAGPFPGTEEKPWGSSRPGRNLYTDSLVKLDAKTGKLRWYFQLTPHDLYDWDLQDPPILTRVQGRPAVVTAGKAGFVIALDRATGRLLWKKPVGRHNGHDQDNLYAMRGQYGKLHMPQEVYPGLLGGVIAPISTDGSTVFVPVVNNSVQYTSQTQQGSGQTMTGELVALDLDTGARKWRRTFPAAAFGATTVVNDVVFVTTFDGIVSAFDTATGKEKWSDQLPAQANSGVWIHGDTVLAPAGLGGSPALVAYRLGG
jgi:glucose dehydrogenase